MNLNAFQYNFKTDLKIHLGSYEHRQPKLRLRAAHKLDCFFHAMHNNDIGNI